MVTKTKPFFTLAFSTSHDDDAALRKVSSKVWRAVERLRRTALKASEALAQSALVGGHQEALDLVTKAILDVLLRVVVSVWIIAWICFGSRANFDSSAYRSKQGMSSY